jgi:hypothetical protein
MATNSAQEAVEGNDPLNLVDHWVPQAEWLPDRLLASCYLTLPEQHPVLSMVLACQRAVASMPEMDLVPVPWLHVTVQALDFVDRLPSHRLDGFVWTLGNELAALPAPRLRVCGPALGGSGAFLVVEPAEKIVEVREVVRDVARRTLGLTRPYQLPGQGEGGSPPHLSFAYSNATVPRAAVMERLASVPVEPVELTLPSLSFLLLRRVARTWRWQEERGLIFGVHAATRARSLVGGRGPDDEAGHRAAEL